MTPGQLVQTFFQAYLAAPIVIVFYVGFKLIKKTKFKRIQDIDITSGRRELDLASILAEERALQAKWPRWKKIYKTIC
jgi:amino acid transporter